MSTTLERTDIRLAELEGKDVIVLLDNERGDVEGRVIKANSFAIVVKSGSKTNIYEQREILDVEIVDKTKPKKVLVRWIAEPTADKIRQHLADRHAIPVDLIPVDPEQALELHSKIDHNQRNLGHRHGDKPRRRRIPADPGVVAERAALLEAKDNEDIYDDEEYDELN